MKKATLLLLLLATLYGCTKQSGAAIIHGEIEGMENDTIRLYTADGLRNRIDTIYVKRGKFSQTLQVDTASMGMLVFKGGEEYPVFLDKKAEIKITGSITHLQSLAVEGTTSNEELTAFTHSLKELGKPSEETMRDKAREFIRIHHSSPVSVYLLDKYFVQSESPDYTDIKELIEFMTGTLQDHPAIIALNEYLARAEQSQAGRPAPYFSLPNNKEKFLSHSNDFKDKYLLLSFWASWDEPSKENNKELRKIYRTHQKNKKFGMLGISLDIDKTAWKEGIKQDTLKWEQVCDFTGWNSETARQYAILKLPANLLLSPSGTIVVRDVSTDSIARKLNEVLKETNRK